MSWLRMHPYAAACAAAGLLIIVGALIVESRTARMPSSLSVWGGSGAPLLNPSSYAPQATIRQTTENGGVADVSPSYIPPRQTSDPDTEASVEDMDFDSFLASLLSPTGQKSPSATTSAAVDYAYSFIPQGLIATTAPVLSRTPEQQMLFDYGNDAGSYIQTYEDSNRNAPTALRDQAEDRQNTQKIQAVRLVAGALRTAGESLLGMENVPSSAAATHRALAESYIEVGQKLSRVADANGDEAFIAAITAYNGAADSLVHNYVSLATIFSLNGVKFSPQDPGSVFIFSGGGGF